MCCSVKAVNEERSGLLWLWYRVPPAVLCGEAVLTPTPPEPPLLPLWIEYKLSSELFSWDSLKEGKLKYSKNTFHFIILSYNTVKLYYPPLLTVESLEIVYKKKVIVNTFVFICWFSPDAYKLGNNISSNKKRQEDAT